MKSTITEKTEHFIFNYNSLNHLTFINTKPTENITCDNKKICLVLNNINQINFNPKQYCTFTLKTISIVINSRISTLSHDNLSPQCHQTKQEKL